MECVRVNLNGGLYKHIELLDMISFFTLRIACYKHCCVEALASFPGSPLVPPCLFFVGARGEPGNEAMEAWGRGVY